MRTFIQFFEVNSENEIAPIPGDQGFIRADGRLSVESIHNFARATCNKQDYAGYLILEGKEFKSATPKTSFIPLRVRGFPLSKDCPIDLALTVFGKKGVTHV